VIRSLTISGFRGISKEVPLTFGRFTLLAGRNGLGKTTVFDAIDWCLFGPSWRLGFDKESVRNIYRRDLSPAVRLELRFGDATVKIERTSTTVTLNGSRVSDRELVETLMLDPEGVAPYARDVERRLRRVLYLSQEELRAMVRPESASERASLFQALLGVPNASIVESGLRRVREHFKQREQEMRLSLGQLRVKRAELDVALKGSSVESIDTTILISEVSNALGLSTSLTIDDLARRSRQELDKLSAQSVRLDDAVSSIAAFRERRRADALTEENLQEEIGRQTREEIAAASANDRATQALVTAGRTYDELKQKLASMTESQERLEKQVAARKTIGELTVAETDAADNLLKSQDAADRLTADSEACRRASDFALERRSNATTKLSEIRAARDQALKLNDLKREEAELSVTTGSLTEAIAKQDHDRELLQIEIRGAEALLIERRDEYERLNSSASSSNALDALLQQVLSLLPPDLKDCPLCGTSFESQNDLVAHISSARGRYALTSDTLGQALTGLRTQEQLVRELGRRLKAADSALASTQVSRNEALARLSRAREAIASLPAAIEVPGEQQFDVLRDELKSIDEELRKLKVEADDKNMRLNVLRDDLSRQSVRRESIGRQLALSRQTIDDRLSEPELQQEVDAGRVALGLAATATREAEGAEKLAREAQLKTQSVTHSIARELANCRSQQVGLRERRNSESSTLLQQIAELSGETGSIDVAAERLNERRATVMERFSTLNRLWPQLVVATTAERSKAIRTQTAEFDREIAVVQKNLDWLLRANSRFLAIAGELQRTAQSEAVDALQHQQDYIQECYSSIYPHSHLNEIRIRNEPLGGVMVTDGQLDAGVEPTTYLSTGQANVLALSYFLGIALRQRVLNIGVVCMDEPVQHLDDVNFLGFVSLLKRVGLSTQVVMSTADTNVTEIITRQMQSSWIERPGDFVRYDWHSFEAKSGPRVEMWRGTTRAIAS
jgi:DNA repair exonuclease SbcCD ATPase subunit